MKQNKNKLARNAIRARKAQIKRANEQDKPKKGKRWLTRLFALVGCLLLVSALVVPCFADSDSVNESDLLTAFEEEYASSYVIYDNPAYRLIRPYVMDCYLLFGGTVSETNVFLMSFSYSSPVSISVTIPFVYLGYSFSIEQGDGGYSSVSEGYIELTVSMGNVANYPDYGTFQIAFFETESGSEGVLELLIEGDLHLVTLQTGTFMEAVPSVVTVDDVPWAFGRELDWLDLCVGLADIYQVGFPFLNVLISLLYGSVTDRYVLYPATFKQGYNSVHYDPDREEAYHRGFDDGYNVGHTKAVNEIKSGDFGRNFLSGVFTTPLSALSNFNIVEWQTSDGTTISISIMTVLSGIVGLTLFIWFLKMFAGG